MPPIGPGEQELAPAYTGRMKPSAEGFMDAKAMEFPCDTCGAVLHSTVGEARRSSTLECPNGHPIEHDAEELDASIRRAEQRVGNIMSRFTF